MSVFSVLERAARNYRRRRAMAETDRIIASLPHEIRKDIGWPEPARTRANPGSDMFGW